MSFRSALVDFSRILSTILAGSSSSTSILSSKSSSSMIYDSSTSVMPLMMSFWSSIVRYENTSTDISFGSMRNMTMAIFIPSSSIISSSISAASTPLFLRISSLALLYCLFSSSSIISSTVSSKVFSSMSIEPPPFVLYSS